MRPIRELTCQVSGPVEARPSPDLEPHQGSVSAPSLPLNPAAVRGKEVITANGSENRSVMSFKKTPQNKSPSWGQRLQCREWALSPRRGCGGVLLAPPSRPCPHQARLQGLAPLLPVFFTRMSLQQGYSLHRGEPSVGPLCPACCLLQTSLPGSPSFLQPSVPHRQHCPGGVPVPGALAPGRAALPWRVEGRTGHTPGPRLTCVRMEVPLSHHWLP